MWGADNIRVNVNGQSLQTEAATLFELRDSMCTPADKLITIIDGYHTNENRALREGDEIIFIEKGKLPPQSQMEKIMMARNTPGVHDKLKKARVAVAGLGGLGSGIAINLARIGVGCLHLIDFDIVEPSNLNRQQYRLCHLGMPKAYALEREISEINPFTKTLSECVEVTPDNAVSLFKDDDIVCEAFDNPAAKAMLVNRLLEARPNIPLVAASGLAGYGSGNAITTRRISGRFYICGDGETAAEPGRGLMSPRVAICAGHQANMVLRIILGEDEV